MIKDYIVAILYREGVLGLAKSARSIKPYTDVPNDNVMCILDEQGRHANRAAGMGKCDAAARCRLPGNCQIRVTDHGWPLGEADGATDLEDANPWSASF